MKTTRSNRPHPLYRIPMFYIPRPPKRRKRCVEGADFDEFRDELRRDRDRAYEGNGFGQL
jgi:hypothetical protein